MSKHEIDRHEEFFQKLDELIDQYPDVFVPNFEDEEPGHVDGEALFRAGVVMVLSYQTMAGHSMLRWFAPTSQNAYTSYGMLHKSVGV